MAWLAIMTRPETSAGEALVFLLEAYGVRTIFGIPGVHNVEMYRALPRSGIRHILARHEQGAGFMADGYARAAGRPGVCFTITGPGLTNIMTAMGQAWSDSSPILVISSALDTGDAAQGRGRLHEMVNQLAGARAVTVFARAASTAQDVQDALAEAFAGFASSRPRPAYLEIPLDLLNQPAGPGWQPRGLPDRPQAAASQLEAAAALLAGAATPMIILGGGALEAGAAALTIAEKLGAPIVTTTAGKGAVPEAHPLCYGYRLSSAAMQAKLRDTDVVLAAGTELSETDFWTSSFRFPGRLIRIDLDPANLARPHAAAVPILADAASTLTAIAAALTGRPADHARAAASAVADFKALEQAHETPLRSQLRQVLAVIRDALPADTVVASDMTQIAYAANAIFPAQTARSWLHPVGFGTLGFALPAGIGAAFATPGKPVAVLAGDYGFQYTANELGTAAEHQLPLIILLWNNEALGQIRDDMVNKGIQPNAVTLKNPDFLTLALAYGIPASRPPSLKALGAAIRAALEAKGPALIEMTPRMDGFA